MPRELICPIVEYFPVYCEDSRGGANQEVFRVWDDDGAVHPYFQGLKSELQKSCGLYIFYDSRGHALYVGQTAKNNLWAEMKNAYNRDRDVQRIRLVDHPLGRKRDFNPYTEERRKISERSVPLYELANYFSAYAVAAELIDDLEALLIRAFANNLLNVHMEKFTE